MREASLVPTNLINWPRVAPLLPEQKLILLVLWASHSLSCAGAGLVPLRPFASSLGLSPEATQTGLDSLANLGLIVIDDRTGEIFIRDWFRFHKFPTGKSYSMLLAAVEKIESQQLKNLVRSLLPPPPVYLSKIPVPAAASAKHVGQGQDAVDEATGVILRDDQDRELLANLVKRHGVETMRERADGARQDGRRPFVSAVADHHAAARNVKDGGKSRGLDGEYDPSNPYTGPVLETLR